MLDLHQWHVVTEQRRAGMLLDPNRNQVVIGLRASRHRPLFTDGMDLAGEQCTGAWVAIGQTHSAVFVRIKLEVAWEGCSVGEKVRKGAANGPLSRLAVPCSVALIEYFDSLCRKALRKSS